MNLPENAYPFDLSHFWQVHSGKVTWEFLEHGVTFIPSPETFRVEEMLPFPLEGHGEHTYLQIEKRNLSTSQACRLLSSISGVPLSVWRHAGLKDQAACAIQWLSYPHARQKTELMVGAPLNHRGELKILHQTKHVHGLRPGLLRGNGFEITLQGKKGANLDLPSDTAPLIPNFFGPQRFAGFDEVRFVGLGSRATPFQISQAQALCFNRFLALRLAQCGWEEQPDDFWRYLPELEGDQSKERMATGPMVGGKMPQRLCTLEREFLTHDPLARHLLSLGKTRAPGSRRFLGVRALGLKMVSLAESNWRCSFWLPAGSFATMALVILFSRAGTELKNGWQP
jgi:tRNA pseudouridine13 synthase